MELTDAIRTKHFNTVLDSHSWKTSNEYTALAALKFCYGEKYKYLKHSESPDLQDVENSIAIEVTNSITPNDAQITGEFVRLGQSGSEIIKAKCRKKISNNGAKLNGDGFMIWQPRGPENEKAEIITAFTQKLKKVSEYSKKGFKQVGLLIYHEKPLFGGTEDEFSEWLIKAQKNSSDKFDFVYILHIEGLMFYDFMTGEKSHIDISHDDIYALGNLARMAAEGEVKDDDPIW